MTRPVVKLLVGDLELEDDLLSYEVESDILTPADAFSMSAYNADGGFAEKLSVFDAVKVTVDDELVMTGYIDELVFSVGQQGPTVDIQGRDVFGQLVDCVAEPRTYKNVTLYTLAQLLAAQWVPSWRATASLEAHNVVKVEPGESVMDVLLRVAKKDRVLVWLDPDGTGVVGRPDYLSTPTHGVYQYRPSDPMAAHNNVVSATVSINGRERYSSIKVAGTSGNTKALYGKSRLVGREATDDGVLIERETLLVDGDCKSIKSAREMAQDEVDRRAFQGLTLRYSVPGFYGSPPNGGTPALLAPDTMMAVVDDYAGLDGVYYCTSRRFVCGDRGSYTDLELHAGGWLT